MQLLIFGAPAVADSVNRIDSCRAIFAASTEVALRAQTNSTILPARDKRPGFFSKRLTKLDDLFIDQSRADRFLKTLSQRERTFIYLVLFEHPKMIFGSLGEKLPQVVGVSNGPWTGGKGRFALALPATSERPNPNNIEEVKAYRKRLKLFGEDAYSIVSGLSQAKPDQQFFTFESNDNSWAPGLKYKLEVEIELEPGYFRSKINENHNYGYASAKISRTELEQFGDFFRWVEKNPERQAYAQLLFEYGFNALRVSHEKGRLYDWNSFLTGSKDRRLLSLRRWRQDGAINTKTEIGFAVHALSANKVESNESKLEYKPVARLLEVQYAPKIDEAALGPFVLDHAQYTASARILRTVITSMVKDLKVINDQLGVIAAEIEQASDNFSKSSSKVIELEQVSRITETAKADLEASTIALHSQINSVIDLRNRLHDLGSAEKTHEINSEISALESFIDAAKSAVDNQVSRTEASLSKLREYISESELHLLRQLSLEK